MKKSIKMLAIMLSVLMIVSMLPAVGFASGSVSTFVGTIDFEDLTVGTTYTASSSEYVYIYEAGKVPSHSTAAFYLNKGTNQAATVASGGNGKAANDKYLSVSSSATTQVWLDTTPKTFNQGDQYRFSLDYLPSASAITSDFRPEVKNGVDTVFKFQQAAITVAGTEYAIPTELRSKWVHIDIILTVGNGATGTVKDTFTTYLNGEKIIDAVEWNNYCQNGKSLGRWDFVGKAQAIDNISITYYADGAVYSAAEPKLINDGNSAATGYCNGTLYVADKTVSQVITSLGTDANVKIYTVIDASGNVVANSAAAAGNTLLVKNINDMTYSISMAGNTLVTTIGKDNWTANGSEITTTTDSFGADSATVVTENISGSTPGKVSYNLTNGTNPHFLRIPILAVSGMQMKVAGRIMEGSTPISGGHCLVNIDGGKIYVDAGNDGTTACTNLVGTYTDNEWLMLEIALFPGDTSFAVRINGGEVHTGHLGANGNYYDTFSQNGYVELQISDGKPSVQLGDVQVYTGVPTSVTAPSLTAVPAGTTLADNAITVPYGKDASAYITGSSITASNASTVKFIGTDGKSIASGYNGGKMVLISADGIYKYYTLNARKEACTLMSTDDAGNKTYWVDLTTNGGITPIVYNALFNNTVLDRVTTIDNQWVINDTTFEFTVAPHTGSTTRKIMIWDKNTLVPLAGNLN